MQDKNLNRVKRITLTALLVLPLLIILFLLPVGLINALLSAIVVLLAIMSGYLCYVIFTDNDEASIHSLTPIIFIITALFVGFLAISMGYFGYWLVMFQPFEVVCRVRDCTTGPYGWSAALLAFTTALLMLIASCKMLKRYFFNKDKSAKSTKR